MIASFSTPMTTVVIMVLLLAAAVAFMLVTIWCLIRLYSRVMNLEIEVEVLHRQLVAEDQTGGKHSVRSMWGPIDQLPSHRPVKD